MVSIVKVRNVSQRHKYPQPISVLLNCTTAIAPTLVSAMKPLVFPSFIVILVKVYLTHASCHTTATYYQYQSP